MKRYRKHYHPLKLRYFLVGEYGGQFGRPHYHAIIFNLPNKSIYELNQELTQIWDNGFTSIANVTDSRLNYVCKYCIQNLQGKKSYSCESEYPPFLSSRNPGIGSSYVNDGNLFYHLNNETVQTYIDGKPYILPRYLKDKIFSDYPDIKDRMTQEYLQKEKEEYDKISQIPNGYNDRNQIALQSGKHIIQRFIKYRKGTFGQEQLPDHLTYYLNQKDE